jgi:hypothetical protein
MTPEEKLLEAIKLMVQEQVREQVREQFAAWFATASLDAAGRPVTPPSELDEAFEAVPNKMRKAG